MKKDYASFTNSSLGRSKPRKHIFHSFVNSTLKRKKNHSNIGLVEDSTSSTTIVRIIIGLLMVHIVIIGGVLLKGHFDKLAGGVSVPPALTPPPAAPAMAQQAEEVPLQPVVMAPAQQQQQGGNHITQPAQAEADAQQPALFPEDGAAVASAPSAPAAEPVVTTPAPAPVAVEPAPAAPAETQPTAAQADAPTTTVRYLVNSGDTWYGIAQAHGISQDALRAANPEAARKRHLIQGQYINLPVRADSPAAQAAAKAAEAEVGPTYTVKRGDTLASIARRHKMSTAALMKLNNLTDKDARRIKPGQKLKVSK